jgi:transposase InsO family protein
MDDEKKTKIALFKYGLIAHVLHGNAKVKAKYFREISQKEYDVPYIGRKRFKPGTFKDWLRRYRKFGIDGLIPKERYDKGISRKIDANLAEEIKEAVICFPYLSGSGLHRLLVSEGKIDPGGINEGTLRKFIQDNKLKEKAPPVPRKKFEKEHINQLWTADCMHGPYIKLNHFKRKHKVFLIAAIDDHSRVIVARGWFTHENSIGLEIVLKDGIARFGLPQKIYCDNGNMFSSSHLQMACARLGIALIHSKPYDSPSRGKVERFFRTVRSKFLSVLDLNEIGNIQQINDRFEKWLEKEYHKHIHSGIGERPMDRFMRDVKENPLKRIPQEQLDRAFQITIHRKVKNDATVSINGVTYECPPEFIGNKIEIRHPSDKPKDLTIYKGDKPVRKLKEIDLHQNANVPARGINFYKGKEE